MVVLLVEPVLVGPVCTQEGQREQEHLARMIKYTIMIILIIGRNLFLVACIVADVSKIS